MTACDPLLAQEQIQAVLDANLLSPLIHLLATAEFDIKKEAAWAISNATSGGTADQIRQLVQSGCIKPLCELLTVNDARIITVALEGLENILKVGQTETLDLSQSSSTCIKLIKTLGLKIPMDRLQNGISIV